MGIVGYVLLFLAPVSGGLTALACVALAYARKPSANPMAASHFTFQIKVFWIAFLACFLGVTAIVFSLGILYSDVVWAVTDNAERVARYFAEPGQAGARFHPLGALSLLGGLGLLCAAAAWSLAASTFGAVRLLSRQPIGGHR